MVHKIKKALILSAGFGTRLKPLTESTPKALIKVAGVAQLDRIIKMLAANGFEEVYINTHYLADKIDSHVKAANYTLKVSTIYEPEILGTGGSIANIFKHYVNEPMLVINCDAIFYNGDPIALLSSAWDPSSMNLLAILQAKVIGSRGDFNLDEDGHLLRLNCEMDYTFAGCYIISPEIFKSAMDGFLPITDIIFSYSEKYFGLVNEGEWLDIGTLQDLQKANDVMRSHDA